MYERPTLERLGTLRELTRAGGANTPGDGANPYHRYGPSDLDAGEADASPVQLWSACPTPKKPTKFGWLFGQMVREVLGTSG